MEADATTLREEAIIFNMPDTFITLGNQKYGLKRLSIKRSLEWRQQAKPLFVAMQKLLDSKNVQMDTAKIDMNGDVVTEMVKLVASYVGEPSLTPALIEEQATEQQLVSAFVMIGEHLNQGPIQRPGTSA